MQAGAPQEVIDAARLRGRGGDQDFGVWEENWNSLLFFLDKCSTQWNVIAGMAGGGYIGLRFEAIEASMRMARIPPADRPALLDDLIIIERAALKVLNKVEE